MALAELLQQHPGQRQRITEADHYWRIQWRRFGDLAQLVPKAIHCPVTDLKDAPCWIRTNDRLLRRQLLYPAELREQTLQSCQ